MSNSSSAISQDHSTPPCPPTDAVRAQGDCFYRAFDDAPIVPSTTVSHSTLSLVLHVRGSRQSRGAGTPEPAGPAGGEVPRIEPPAADDEGGGEQQDGDVGRTGGTGAVAGGGTGAIPGADANQDAAAGGIVGAVGESKDAVQERPSASSGKDSATSSCGAEGGGAVSSVVVSSPALNCLLWPYRLFGG